MTTNTSMTAPSPGQRFIGCPSGTIYVADNSGNIANVSNLDVLALIEAGCLVQDPVAANALSAAAANALAIKGRPGTMLQPMGHRVGIRRFNTANPAASLSTSYGAVNNPVWGLQKTFHMSGPNGLIDPRIQFGNFSLPANAAEVPNTNAITISCAILYGGVYYPAFWNGARFMTLQGGAQGLFDPISLVIPPLTQYTIQTYVTVTTAGYAWPLNGAVFLTGEGFNVGTSANYPSGDPTLTSFTPAYEGIANQITPLNIYGRGSTPSSSVLIIGDSRSVGPDGASGSAQGETGYFERGLSNNVAWANFGIGGDTIVSRSANHFYQSQAWQTDVGNFTHAFCGFSINDISAGTSLAAIQAAYLALWNDLNARGLAIWQSTPEPHATSTDSFVTTANQTAAANCGPTGLLQQVCDWMRTVPAPLTGVLDVSDCVSSGRNSGKWAVGSTSGSPAALTGDGLHCNVKGDAYAATYIAYAWAKIASGTAGYIPVPSAMLYGAGAIS